MLQENVWLQPLRDVFEVTSGQVVIPPLQIQLSCAVILSAAKDLRLSLRIHPIQGTTIIRRLAVVPFAAQVNPGRVHLLDEGNFAVAFPAFQFLLASDGFGDLVVDLEPYQAIAVITGGKTVLLFPIVLEHSLL